MSALMAFYVQLFLIKKINSSLLESITKVALIVNLMFFHNVLVISGIQYGRYNFFKGRFICQA